MNGHFPFQIVSNVLDPIQLAQTSGFGVLTSVPQSIQYVPNAAYNNLPDVSSGMGMCFPVQQPIINGNSTYTLVNQSGVTYLAVTPNVNCNPVTNQISCFQPEAAPQGLQLVQVINNTANNAPFVVQNCTITNPSPQCILPVQQQAIAQVPTFPQCGTAVNTDLNTIQQLPPPFVNFSIKTEPIDQESHEIMLNNQGQNKTSLKCTTMAHQTAQNNQHPLTALTSLTSALTNPQLSSLQQTSASSSVIHGGQPYIPGNANNICIVGKQETASEDLGQPLVNNAQTFHVLIPTSQGMAIQTVLANYPNQAAVSQSLPVQNPIVVQAPNLVNVEQSNVIPLQIPVNCLTPQPSFSNQLSSVVDVADDAKVSVSNENTQSSLVQANTATSHNLSSTEVKTKTEVTQDDQEDETAEEIPALQDTHSISSPDSSCCLPDSTDDLCQPTIKQSSSSIVDGIDLEEIREFARTFKMRRLFLGLTQTQVGQALCATEGPAYSQSAICRFEKLDITPRSAMKIRPVLEKWLREAEAKYQQGQILPTGVDYVNLTSAGKIRKRRTFFSAEALAVLNTRFDQNSHPSGREINSIAQDIGYDRDVVRVWFCNKRQSLRQSSTSQRGRIHMKSS